MQIINLKRLLQKPNKYAGKYATASSANQNEIFKGVMWCSSIPFYKTDTYFLVFLAVVFTTLSNLTLIKLTACK